MFVECIIFWICFQVWLRPIKPLPNCENVASLNTLALRKSLEKEDRATCSITENDQSLISLFMNIISQHFVCFIQMRNSKGFSILNPDIGPMQSCSFRKLTRNISWNYIPDLYGVTSEFRNGFVLMKVLVTMCSGSALIAPICKTLCSYATTRTCILLAWKMSLANLLAPSGLTETDTSARLNKQK